MPHMKTDLPIEFSLSFNLVDDAQGKISRTFIFPTFPSYLNEKTYNQKCMVEFISFSCDGALTAAESICYIVFKGIKSNQFRLKKTNNALGNAIVSQEFVPTPLSLLIDTHTGALNLNAGNISMGTSNPIICDNLWGSQVELEFRELAGIGADINTNYAVKHGAVNIGVVMRITPISEEKCGCM